MDEKRLTSLKELEGGLGYQFKDIEWLHKALIHRSFSNEQDCPEKQSNEVLEFLGDAVLNLAVSHLLLQKFPDAQEGTLSMKRAHLVKQSSLAFLSRGLQLEEYLLLGKGEILNGGRKKTSILADAYEALFGAVYMDSGLDRVIEILQNILDPYLQSGLPSLGLNDYKSLLQEEAQRIHGQSPEYRVLQESGPNHNKMFQVSVSIGSEVKGTGWGKSKKEAEQEAAKNALEELQIADSRLQIEEPET
jgi:ribonuclease III